MLECLTIGLLISSLLTSCGVRAPTAQFSEAFSAVSIPMAIEYQVRTRVLEDAALDDDGVQLAQYRYELPELVARQEDGTALTDDNAAVHVTETFNSRFDQWYWDSDFSQLAALATELRHSQTELEIPWQEDQFTEEFSYTSWQTEHLVSIRGYFYSNSGGTHPNTLLLGWNFSLDSGEYITPVVLAEDDQQFLDNVTAEILRQAEARAAEAGLTPEEYYVEDYVSIAAEWANYAVSFDETGMTVGFSPYELACYAAGCQEFFLSYETLRPWLSDYGLQTLGLS